MLLSGPGFLRRLWSSRQLIMISAHNDCENVSINCVNQPVNIINSSRPEAAEVFLE